MDIFEMLASGATGNKVKIACVGDSITYGFGVEDTRDRDSYPAMLNRILGSDYQVLNYGLNGRTLTLAGDTPYIREEEYRRSFWDEPDVYICMLGTNDSKPYNWDIEAYEKELKVFLRKYADTVGADRVYMMFPPRAFPVDGEIIYHVNNDRIIALQPVIRRVAESLGIAVIDLYSLTEDHPEWFADGVHPNRAGNEHISALVAESIGRPGKLHKQ